MMMRDGWNVLICVAVALVALFVGFAMGVDSVMKEIVKYGCVAVLRTWGVQP